MAQPDHIIREYSEPSLFKSGKTYCQFRCGSEDLPSYDPHSEPDERIHPHQAEAAVFIRTTVRERRRVYPDWGERSRAQHSDWKYKTNEQRGLVESAIFEDYEKRIANPEAQGDQNEWRRAEDQIEWDRTIRKLGMDERWVKFNEVDWNKGATQARIREYDIDDPAGKPSEVRLNEKEEEAYLDKSFQDINVDEALATEVGEMPQARRATEPETIQTGRTSQPPQVISRTQQLLDWEEDQADPRKAAVPQAGFHKHPDRPWSREDEHQLLDIIHDEGVRDFEAVSERVQRREDQCRAKYRWLANLEPIEPRVGGWTFDTDGDLMRFRWEYGLTDWDRIAYHCGTTAEEARQRWRDLTSLDPDNPRYTAEDEEEEDRPGEATSPTASDQGSGPETAIRAPGSEAQEGIRGADVETKKREAETKETLSAEAQGGRGQPITTSVTRNGRKRRREDDSQISARAEILFKQMRHDEVAAGAEQTGSLAMANVVQASQGRKRGRDDSDPNGEDKTKSSVKKEEVAKKRVKLVQKPKNVNTSAVEASARNATASKTASESKKQEAEDGNTRATKRGRKSKRTQAAVQVEAATPKETKAPAKRKRQPASSQPSRRSLRIGRGEIRRDENVLLYYSEKTRLFRNA